MKYWHSRIGIKANGEYSYDPYTEAVLNNSSNEFCNGSDPANWQLRGPIMHEDQQQGYFEEVLYDPDYPAELIASTNHGGIWKFRPDNGNVWENVTDNLGVPGLSASDFLRNPYDSDIIFAASANGQWHTEYGVGLLVSENRGNSWTISQSFINHTGNDYTQLIRVIADTIDNNPTDGIDIYVAGKKKIYKGLDNGTSWQTITPPELTGGQEIYEMEINENGQLLIGTYDPWSYGLGKAYILIGNQWQEILQENNIYGKRVKISTPKDGKVFAIKDNLQVINEDTSYLRSLYSSTNNGVTWTLVKESIISGGPKCEIEYSAASNFLYVPTRKGMIIYRTNGVAGQNFPANYINFHPDVRDIFICGIEKGIEKVYVANDGGISEVNVNIGNPTRSSIINKNGSYLPCNNAIGLAVSNSITQNWFTSNMHQGTFWFVGNELIKNDRGDGEDGVYNPIDKEVFYTNTNGTIRSSINNTAIHLDGSYSNGGFVNMRMELNPNDPSILYFGLKRRLGIYNETTQQTTYSTTITPNYDDTLKAVGPIAISKENDIYIAAYEGRDGGETGVLFVSNNNANTWEDISLGTVWKNNDNLGTLSDNLGWNQINGIVCNPNNNNELWIAIGRIKQGETLRVLHSTDGGDNWHDYSNGLPGFPAIDFIYHHQTETLFLGTDVGVFYRHPFNDVNGEWACLSDGLPVGAVTELDINNCSNELFVSMQSRSVFSTPIPFPTLNEEELNGNTTISILNTTWNETRKFDGNITILPGASLTINSNCYFSEGNSIIVMPGAKLTVNAKLGNLPCSLPWQGIQAVGNSNQLQHPDNQALVYLNANAKIANAIAGVATYELDSQGQIIANSGGAIIKANGATFFNNKIGAEIRDFNMPDYTHLWQTEFIDCEFIIDEDYYVLFESFNETPRCIEMTDNKRIRILDNTFESTKPPLDDWTLYPYGILKYNSQAQIQDNSFEGLSYGIYSQDYYPGSYVDNISHNTFKASVFGIYENGVNGSQIYDNTIKVATVSDNLTNSNAPNFIGVYKNACTNYLFDENDFSGNMTNQEKPLIGLLINNGGPNDQLIYKNDFEGFDYAILAQGTNRNSTGSSGLSFKCNYMSFEHNDIAVSASFGSTIRGVAASQGSGVAGNTQAAGNLFNDFVQGPSVEGHFLNISDLNATVTYHHHTSANPSDYDRLIPGHIDPTLINGVVVSENDQSSWNSDLSCPSQLNLGIGGKLEKLEDSGEGISSTESTLNLLIDAGDTPEMTNEVQAAQSSEAYELQTELLNSSPYLSNEVLETATDKEEVLTNPLIRDVLVANPQSAKNEEVLELIDNRVNPMPQYMKDQILSGQAIISAKEQMEAELHQHRLDYNYTLSTLVSEYSNENGENYSIENLTQMLSTAQNKESRYQLAALRLQEGNTNAMSAALNSVAIDFDLTNEESQELSDITAYYNLLSQIQEDNRDVNELTNDEILDLQTLYENSNNKAAVYARNLLFAAEEIEYEAPVIYPDFGNKSALITTTANSNTSKNNLTYIDVYPNPARDYIIFEYDISASFDKAQINVFHSVKGTLVMQKDLTDKQNAITIGTKEWVTGTYLVSILVDGKIVKSTKFNVVNK